METMSAPRAASMPTQEHFARNFIGGRWQFPAAPFEFDICNPATGSILATVPLSSRLEVARAIAAAGSALEGEWARPDERNRCLRALADLLTLNAGALAALQSIETGLDPLDSRAGVEATLQFCWQQVHGAGALSGPEARGVSGHILSWGLPLAEVVLSTLSSLARGGAVVVKPSLRAPLSAVAFACLAEQAGFPPGVVNVVHGTGVDVGADLMARRELSGLHVRAGDRTIAAAERSRRRTDVPLQVLRAGGNLAVVGPDADSDLNPLLDAVVTGVRRNNAGGPFGLPLLAVHRDRVDDVVPAVLAALDGTVAAPVPTEALRYRALSRIETLRDAGARVLLGGTRIPDDIPHRMGWRIPPTVLMLGSVESAGENPALRADQAGAPLGPVLGILTWSEAAELGSALTAVRAGDGVAVVWGTVDGRLPHASTVAGPGPAALPASWSGGL